MRQLSDTLNRLANLRARPEDMFEGRSRLAPLTAFGSNPGKLKAYSFVPDAGLPDGAPLVVVLHGCKQTAASYDRGSGWSQLAEEYGFALVFAEQQTLNNPQGCFSWFDPIHTAREGGEAQSISQMVEHMLDRHPGLDARRVFVTGLSAGGAMTAVMLATYPDIFAGGAVIAGLPFSTAASVPQAFDRMRGHGGPSDPAELGRLVSDASAHEGPWPTLSVWHGTHDHVVVPANAETLIAQWRTVHDLREAPDQTEVVDGHRRRVWLDEAGREAIESYDIAGMGHGVPLNVAATSGPYMFDVGISSTHRIAAFWNIIPKQTDSAHQGRPTARPQIIARNRSQQDEGPRTRATKGREPQPPVVDRVRQTIEQALRSAGLLR